jgi:RNA 2',3'-cyclic 3'-phosphodiesterase
VVEFFRTFIAMELPADLRAKISAHIDYLRRQLPDVRASWVREGNLHLTLKFLGDTPVARIESVSAALLKAANETTAFEIRIGGCGAFAPRGKPSVLWIGIEDPSGGLKALHANIEESCAAVGFARDSRQFHPHLTIARLRQAHGTKELAELHRKSGFPTLIAPVNDVCLIRSELSSAGSRYTVIARNELQ